MLTCAFVLLAAGAGTRLGGEPKQFRLLNGTPLWRHAWNRAKAWCEKNGATMLLVAPAGGQLSLEKFGSSLDGPVIPGGASRSASVLAALKYLKTDVVLFHDAARPFLSEALCERVYRAAGLDRAVVPLLPIHDALKKEVNGQWQPHSREGLWLTQTPQAFPRGSLLELLEGAGDQLGALNDEAQLWLDAGRTLVTVEGEIMNRKITDQADWDWAENRVAPPFRVGMGYDIHPLWPGRRLVLGGVEIPSDFGLAGYSDADLLCHAVSDAFLSAAGLGDVGTLFPAGNERYANADSGKLLSEVRRRCLELGWHPSWVTVVLQAQTPRLAAWHDPITARLTELAGCPVQLTFKSGEGVGAVGDGMAMQCWATATLLKMTEL